MAERGNDKKFQHIVGRANTGLTFTSGFEARQLITEFSGNYLDPVELYPNLSEDYAIVPLVYALHLTQKRDKEVTINQLTNTLSAVGLTSSIRLVQGAKVALKAVGFVEVTKLGADVLLSDSKVLATLNSSEDGRTFLKYWQVASIAIDVGTVSANVLDGLINSGTKVSKQLSSNPTTVNYIEEVVANAKLVKGGRLTANSGKELKIYLSGIESTPKGVTYKGKCYRNIDSKYTNPTEIHAGITDIDNRFRRGLYVSETKGGNLLEMNSNTTGRTLYEITEIEVGNLLDVTDPNVLEQLGTTLQQVKLTNVANTYEYTHEIAIWAKNKGYSGVKFYGAQSDTKYVNIVIFEQVTVNNSLKGSVRITPW